MTSGHVSTSISSNLFREMEVFTQFSSDLDATTKAQLQYGNSLMELLKQPLCRPLSMAEQVVTLCTATNKLMVDIDKSKIKKFQMDMLEHFNTMHKDVMEKIDKDIKVQIAERFCKETLITEISQVSPKRPVLL